jgi:hypothetical protein
VHVSCDQKTHAAIEKHIETTQEFERKESELLPLFNALQAKMEAKLASLVGVPAGSLERLQRSQCIIGGCAARNEGWEPAVVRKPW